MKIIVTTGGSGGHIYPSLTVADDLKRRGHIILFVGAKGKMEETVVKNAGYEIECLSIDGFKKGIKSKIKFFNGFLGVLPTSNKILEQFKPDLVIGFGGYASVPMVLSASKKRIPTIIHEQNALAGKANRFLSRFVDRILVSYEDSKKYFPKNKVKFVGNPRTRVSYDLKVEKNPSRKKVLIVMGSLGSDSMNKVFIDLLEIKENWYEIILITGKKYFDAMKKFNKANDVQVLSYVDNLPYYLKSCDLVVSRAGATSLAEIMGAGIPSILIPSPYVSNNHQYINAIAHQEMGCSKIIQEKGLNVVELKKMMESLLNNSSKLEIMRRNALKNANIHALELIIKEIENYA